MLPEREEMGYRKEKADRDKDGEMKKKKTVLTYSPNLIKMSEKNNRAELESL